MNQDNEHLYDKELNMNFFCLIELSKIIIKYNLSSTIPKNIIEAWKIIFPIGSKFIIDEINDFRNNEDKLNNMISIYEGNFLTRSSRIDLGFLDCIEKIKFYSFKLDIYKQIFYDYWYNEIEIPRQDRILERRKIASLKYMEYKNSKISVILTNSDLNRFIGNFL